MDLKLFDSEIKLMQPLWAEGELSAQQLAQRLSQTAGWSKTTTYTMIKKCVDKGLVQRTDPGLMCRALISQEDAQRAEVSGLVDKLFQGSPDLLVASLLSGRKLDPDQIDHLRNLVDQLK